MTGTETAAGSPGSPAPKWMPIAAAASLGLAVVLWFLRRRRLARWALGFAAACMEGVRDARFSRRVHNLLAQAGRDA